MESPATSGLKRGAWSLPMMPRDAAGLSPAKPSVGRLLRFPGLAVACGLVRSGLERAARPCPRLWLRGVMLPATLSFFATPPRKAGRRLLRCRALSLVAARPSKPGLALPPACQAGEKGQL